MPTAQGFCYNKLMTRIEKLKEKVSKLYGANYEGRADWAEYMYTSHVFIVSDYASELSKRFRIQNDLAEAAAMLHDIADGVMSRFNKEHESKSLEIANNFLVEAGFDLGEIEIIIGDIITNHSCRPNHLPQTLEGKIMATADAKAHLDTDFYDFATRKMSSDKTTQEIKEWLSEKIDRDFNVKIFFPEVKEELRPCYEKLVNEYSL